MKVIIDTNVLVSAVLRGGNPQIVIQYIVDSPECEWVVSREILTEYKEVLSRPKFKLPEEVRARWFNFLDTFTTVVEVSISIDFPRDQKDAKFLACAVAAGADFLITGDRDFNQAPRLDNTAIISVSLFKRLVCDMK